MFVCWFVIDNDDSCHYGCCHVCGVAAAAADDYDDEDDDYNNDDDGNNDDDDDNDDDILQSPRASGDPTVPDVAREDHVFTLDKLKSLLRGRRPPSGSSSQHSLSNMSSPAPVKAVHLTDQAGRQETMDAKQRGRERSAHSETAREQRQPDPHTSQLAGFELKGPDLHTSQRKVIRRPPSVPRVKEDAQSVTSSRASAETVHEGGPKKAAGDSARRGKSVGVWHSPGAGDPHGIDRPPHHMGETVTRDPCGSGEKESGSGDPRNAGERAPGDVQKAGERAQRDPSTSGGKERGSGAPPAVGKGVKGGRHRLSRPGSAPHLSSAASLSSSSTLSSSAAPRSHSSATTGRIKGERPASRGGGGQGSGGSRSDEPKVKDAASLRSSVQRLHQEVSTRISQEAYVVQGLLNHADQDDLDPKSGQVRRRLSFDGDGDGGRETTTAEPRSRSGVPLGRRLVGGSADTGRVSVDASGGSNSSHLHKDRSPSGRGGGHIVETKREREERSFLASLDQLREDRATSTPKRRLGRPASALSAVQVGGWRGVLGERERERERERESVSQTDGQAESTGRS